MTTIINFNNFPISPKVNTAQGPHFVHIQAKSKAKLAPGETVDSNWAATATMVNIVDSVPSNPVPSTSN